MYLYKLQLDKEIDISKFDEREKGTITIKIITESDNFNQPVEITAPGEFKTFKEIFSPEGGLFEPYISAISNARDAKRKSDLSQIQVALELYYSDKNSYPQSLTFPQIPLKNYLSALTDPGNGPCPGLYKWIKNIGHPDKYCVYACIENGEYFAVSPDSMLIVSSPPTSLDCGKKEGSSPEFKFPLENKGILPASLLEIFSKIFRK